MLILGISKGRGSVQNFNKGKEKYFFISLLYTTAVTHAVLLNLPVQYT